MFLQEQIDELNRDFSLLEDVDNINKSTISNLEIEIHRLERDKSELESEVQELKSRLRE